jgi:hypothetical protein
LRQLAGWLHYGAEERTATQPIIALDQEERANRSGLQKKIQLGRNRDEAAAADNQLLISVVPRQGHTSRQDLSNETRRTSTEVAFPSTPCRRVDRATSPPRGPRLPLRRLTWGPPARPLRVFSCAVSTVHLAGSMAGFNGSSKDLFQLSQPAGK